MKENNKSVCDRDLYPCEQTGYQECCTAWIRGTRILVDSKTRGTRRSEFLPECDASLF